jgi:hypothetical protein
MRGNERDASWMVDFRKAECAPVAHSLTEDSVCDCILALRVTGSRSVSAATGANASSLRFT